MELWKHKCKVWVKYALLRNFCKQDAELKSHNQQRFY